MKYLVFGLLSLGLLCTCTQPEEEVEVQPSLIFGWFYGECMGETCVEIYKLEGDLLLEDVNDTYPGQSGFYSGDFSINLSENVEEVSSLLTSFPYDLLLESETVLGIPDAGDWGGIYIEFNDGTAHDFWLIDTMHDNIPGYLHSYVDLVLEKVQGLSN